MRTLRFFWMGLFLLLSVSARAAVAPVPKSPYKLGVILVIDQFRADYFMRFQFNQGLKFLKDGGAYFPLADHALFQNMTGPGHAAIMSGAYPYRHGIPMNYWYNHEKSAVEYCVQDDQSKVIGSNGVVTTAKSGISPKLFNATTVTDELKNVDRPSKVVALAVKERAAVLLAGKRADHVYWLDDVNCQWVTSEFYHKTLPDFAKKVNVKLQSEKGKPFTWGPFKGTPICSKESLLSPWTVTKEFEMAIAAMDDQKLGQGKDTDFLLVSLSSHDYLGHRFGPNSQYMEDMAREEDRQIEKFIKDIEKRVPGGLNNVFFVFTGDHGIPPSPGSIPEDEIANGNIPEDFITKKAETELTEAFGKPKGGKWIDFISEFQFYLNQTAMKDAKITASDVGRVLRAKFTQAKLLDQLFVRDDILIDRKVPPGDLGKALDHTLTRRNGDIVMVLNPFHWSDTYPVTHMTHYSYDRYVPLIFWGKTFKPGVYRQIVNIADLAPTLSSVLNVLPPSQSEGRVLTEILR